MSEEGRFWGKYRGVVLNNLDPLQIGRLQVQVPAVTGALPSTWAMPCAPMAGSSGPVVAAAAGHQRLDRV
jgi:hypothetical protein